MRLHRNRSDQEPARVIDAVLRVLNEHDRFIITTHIRPDGDAIGSQIALGRFLEKLGKHVTLLNSDTAPYNLLWLPNVDQVQVFDRTLDQLEAIQKADVWLIIDTNARNRTGYLGQQIQRSKAKKVLIDHHTNPEQWFDVMYVDDQASSTGEMIYRIIEAQDATLVDEVIGHALYTAIMTDTGSFRFSSVTAAVHRTIAEVVDRGQLQVHTIHENLFDTKSMPGLRLLSRALDSLTLLHDGQLGYIVITQQMVRDVEADLSETDGFVNYALSIEGVRAAVMFTETTRGIKMSFRSKGEAHVNEWAAAFGGGGHRNASGAFVRNGVLDKTVKKVLAAAPDHINFGETADAATEADEDAAYLAALEALKEKFNAR
ncbi:MAG: bifunctional oligoribonuclease/PAP phosphatase NrnA [Rhodothermales bacterium]